MLVGILVAIAGLLGGWMFYNRAETGKWRMPTGDDLVRIKQRIAPGKTSAPKVVYLHRGPIRLTGGVDDAKNNRSSVIERSGRTAVELRGYRGSEASWRAMVSP